jgi:hypothetical protein
VQEEFDDEDDWNPYKAAGVCMMLLATCCEDDIVPHVLPFVKDNIKHADWRHRLAQQIIGKVLSVLLNRNRRHRNFLPLRNRNRENLLRNIYR